MGATQVVPVSHSPITRQRNKRIQNNIRLLDVDHEDLKYTFAVHVGIDKHPVMIIFERKPQYDDDPVVTVDLVYEEHKINDELRRKNVVRFQGNAWGHYQDEDKFLVLPDTSEISPLPVPLRSIQAFCAEYQEKNRNYDYYRNNCRKFMMELCASMGTTWTGIYAVERMWYKRKGNKN